MARFELHLGLYSPQTVALAAPQGHHGGDSGPGPPGPDRLPAMDTVDTAYWGPVAEALLRQALDEHEAGEEAIVTTEIALLALRAEAGELPAGPLEDLLVAYGPVACTCPPELAARGGFRSSCPACGPG